MQNSLQLTSLQPAIALDSFKAYIATSRQLSVETEMFSY